MAKTLGKGLEALIQSYGGEKKEKYLHGNLPIKNIIPNKNQPRQYFNTKEMELLADSIKKRGILQPVTVRKIEKNLFELVAGERRFRAAQMVGLKAIPAYVLNINSESEMMEYALIENIQRVDLNPIEEAEGYAILSGKYNLTHSKIAECVSKSRTEISNKLRLLKLPPKVKQGITNGLIEYGHARALLSLKKSTKIIKIFNAVVNKKLSVRQTEILIKKSQNKEQQKSKLIDSINYYEEEKELTKYLNTKIKIHKKKIGKIIIEFSNDKDLKQIIKKIKNKFII